MPSKNRGQVFTWDVVLATALFLMILGLLAYEWNIVMSEILSSETQFEVSWLASSVSEALVRTPGTPINWSAYYDASAVVAYGLAEYELVGPDTFVFDRIIDADKLLHLVNNSANYSSIRNKLMGSGKYDYYMQIECLNGDLDCFNELLLDTIVNSTVQCKNSQAFFVGNNSILTQRGLAGVWRFDRIVGNTTYDTSGNKNNATLYSVNPTSDGYLGGAISFDGNDYVACGNSSSVVLGPSMTVSAWIKPQPNPATWARMVGKGNTTFRNYGLFRQNNGDILWQIFGTSAINCYAGIHPPEGVWTHIAGTYDGANMVVYINGTTVNICPSIGIPSISPHQLLFGKMDDAYYYNGSLDEVKIFSRALTPEEVMNEYQRKVYCIIGRNVSINETSYIAMDTKTFTLGLNRSQINIEEDIPYYERTAVIKTAVYLPRNKTE